jgi:hypothetical protein
MDSHFYLLMLLTGTFVFATGYGLQPCNQSKKTAGAPPAQGKYSIKPENTRGP